MEGNWLFLIFFISIGVGFMLFEIGFIQRFVVFLGHPSYSMTIVLFSLLLATGIGSIACDKWLKATKDSPILILPLLLLIVILSITPSLSSILVEKFILDNRLTRIIISLGILLPSGFFMGFAFPLGMSLALEYQFEQGPWLWAVNGAVSVLASVIATCTSISQGINFTLKIGTISYIFALSSMVLVLIQRRHKRIKGLTK